MALNIRNAAVEQLGSELAMITGDSKTQAVKIALEERRERLALEQDQKLKSTLEWLQKEVWPRVPLEVRAKMTLNEEDLTLGQGEFDSSEDFPKTDIKPG